MRLAGLTGRAPGSYSQFRLERAPLVGVDGRTNRADAPTGRSGRLLLSSLREQFFCPPARSIPCDRIARDETPRSREQGA